MNIALPQPRPQRVARPGATWQAAPEWTRRIATLILGAAVAAVLLFLTTRTSQGSTVLPIGAVIMVAAVVWLFRTRRLEIALTIVVAYLGLLDGFLRLVSGSSSITLGRDAILYSVTIGVLLRRISRTERTAWPPLTPWIIAWTAFVVVQVLNPSSGPLLHRIVSVRQDLEFVPLFFLAYTAVQSRARLRGFLLVLVSIAAINGAVGLYQSTLSPAQLSGWGSGYYKLVHGIGAAPGTAVGANGKTIVRPPGLGGDMGFGGALGIIAVPAGFALLIGRRRSTRQTLLIAALTVFAVMGVITSQSRASILSAIVALLAFCAMLAASKEGRRVMIGLVAFAVVIGIVLATVSSNSLARYNSIAPSSLAKTVGSSRQSTVALIPKYLKEYPFGAGIGASGPAFGQYGSAANTVDGESQITFLIAEVGIPGLIVMVGLHFKVLSGATRRLRRLRSSESRVMLAAIIAPLFGFVANWYVGINTVAPPNSPYMWGAIGILSYWLFSGRHLVHNRR